MTLPPYLKWRHGRPRWEPGPTLRAAGWHGRDLKSPAGHWLDLAAAIAVAEEINAHVAAWRTGKPRLQARTPSHTCAALFSRYWRSRDFQKLRPATQRDYQNKAANWLDAGFHDRPVASITKPALLAWWEASFHQRGHAMSNGILAVVRRVFSYGELIGWCAAGSNPAKQLRREQVAPRVVVFSDAECATIVAAGDAGDALSIAVTDVFIAALHTGQRLGDVLAFHAPTRNPHGDFIFQLATSKTRARVAVPATPQLSARLDAIHHRRQAAPVAPLHPSGPLFLDPRTDRPWTVNSFGKAWRPLRARAAQTFPNLAHKEFRDLRDTAITRLALAGCTVPQIGAITGHQINTIHSVLRHYLALDGALAATAIAQLTSYMQEERISV